jgi:hypothetical protein
MKLYIFELTNGHEHVFINAYGALDALELLEEYSDGLTRDTNNYTIVKKYIATNRGVIATVDAE